MNLQRRLQILWNSEYQVTIIRVATLGFNFLSNIYLAGYLTRNYGLYFFGLWSTISAISATLVFMDLSISQIAFNQLTNRGRVLEEQEKREIVSKSLLSLIKLTLIYMIGLVGIHFLGILKVVFPNLDSDQRLVILIGVFFFVTTLPLSLGTRFHIVNSRFQRVVLIQSTLPIMNLTMLLVFSNSKVSEVWLLIIPGFCNLAVVSLIFIDSGINRYISIKFKNLVEFRWDWLKSHQNIIGFGTLLGVTSNLFWNAPRWFLVGPVHAENLALYSYLMLFLSSIQSIVLSYNSNFISKYRLSQEFEIQKVIFKRTKVRNWILALLILVTIESICFLANFLEYSYIPLSIFLFLPVVAILWTDSAFRLAISTDGKDLRFLALRQLSAVIFCFALCGALPDLRNNSYFVLLYLIPYLAIMSFSTRSRRLVTESSFE